MQNRDGFSVVEVLASVALIAIAIIPLYQLQRTLSDAAIRLERAQEILEIQNSALAFLNTVNPAEAPEGATPIGDWQMSWTSEQLAFEPDAEGFQGQSNYAIGLYEITVVLQREDTRREFNIRKVGWILIRNPLADLGG